MPLEEKVSKSIFERVGLEGLFEIAWDASPPVVNLFALPYNLLTYHRLLKESANLTELFDKHSEEYNRALLFRIVRPRYHKARRILLQKYEVI